MVAATFCWKDDGLVPRSCNTSRGFFPDCRLGWHCQNSGLDPDFTGRPGEKLPHRESDSSRREEQIGALLAPEP